MLIYLDMAAMWLLRFSMGLQAIFFMIAARYASKSIKKTEYRGMAKGYMMVARGQIKIPDAAIGKYKPLLRLVVIYFLIVVPIETLIREVL